MDIKRYQSLRSVNVSRKDSFLTVLVPERLRVAIHVLKGRPTIYNTVFRQPIMIELENKNMYIVGCKFLGGFLSKYDERFTR